MDKPACEYDNCTDGPLYVITEDDESEVVACADCADDARKDGRPVRPL